jgi:SAM-dependent methyltransferase
MTEKVNLAELHLDRRRAESFGSAAQDYDRYRPSFPDALIDDLVALGGSDALDVGCGTGRVARLLAGRGLSVLGVELDARMADVARAHGVRAEVARFEDWDDAGRRYDLVASGDTWHWIDPKRGAAKAALVLRPGGALVRFWNLQLLEEPAMAALDPVYREHAPEVYVYGRAPTTWPDGSVLKYADPLPLEGPFAAVEAKKYLWERRVTGADWAAFAGTISDHKRLPAERLGRLQAEIRQTLERFGETIPVRIETMATFARRDC